MSRNRNFRKKELKAFCCIGAKKWRRLQSLFISKIWIHFYAGNH